MSETVEEFGSCEQEARIRCEQIGTRISEKKFHWAVKRRPLCFFTEEQAALGVHGE